ncbi:MAG: glycosyltransferase family 9 protein [Candidatus Solibacter usitatus]|nr:glycosyltransferase family 9 protein [Candidatus Solibacter usitatus]
MEVSRILIVRLGAMGDILHAMPAVASLKAAFPGASIAWAIHPKWRDLLEDGGLADELIFIDRRSYSSVRAAATALRRAAFDFAVDLQGLAQSALVAALARTRRVYGFRVTQVREKAAALLYSDPVETRSSHVVDMNLEIAAAAGAAIPVTEFPLPPGRSEGVLPSGPFVLVSPFAGWTSKQWPLENYAVLARRLRHELGAPLVLNGAPAHEPALRTVSSAEVHISSVAGLIDATRRAAAVLGVDSGPMHLGAALHRPGVALFGPTDPARNGPYSPTFAVIRAPGAQTTYNRGEEIHPSMRAIGPDQVFAALSSRL